MDRRDVLGALGFVGAGLTLGPSSLQAADHGKQEGGGGDMPAPLGGLHAHFCGIHVAKKNPKFQLVTQHYCSARGDDMHQCLLFDTCRKDARLLGVEYIITDKLYRSLPDDEKKYWHPHSYEVLSGGLIAPGMAAEAESQFMKGLLTTWGKTWQTWPDPTTPVPLGEPLLIWALTGDGQADEDVVARRDKQFGVSTAAIRERRGKQLGVEVPRISQPKSVDDVGRQWTESGEDRPTPRKR
jgi:hypothetical protein